MCQEGGLPVRLRVTFAAMLFGQGVASSALDDCFMCNALRGAWERVRTAHEMGMTFMEISA